MTSPEMEKANQIFSAVRCPYAARTGSCPKKFLIPQRFKLWIVLDRAQKFRSLSAKICIYIYIYT